MRGMAHHVRSNTPGNNLSFFVFSYFWVCHALETPPVTSMMIPCHLSQPFLITTITFACLCPTTGTTPRALFLPASHPRYGRQGPRKRSRAPSGLFPLCSAPYLLTTHHHHLRPHHLSPPALANAHLGKAGACLPPCTMLAVSTRLCTPCFKCDKNWPTVPRQMQPLPPSQPPLANATLGLQLTVHENTQKTAQLPTATTPHRE